MKNICKKLIIMFVMVLGIIGGYSINVFASDSYEIGKANLNNTSKNSAVVGNQLLKPEIGWKRYDDTNDNIAYTGSWTKASGNSSLSWYNNTSVYKKPTTSDNNILFNFYGTKLRIINYSDPTYYASGQKIIIDGISYIFNENCASSNQNQTLSYEINNLDLSVHTVKIIAPDSNGYTGFDAVDIDDIGSLLPYGESISLDKSSLTLQEGTSKDLMATTTPDSVNVVWSSSDETIATVDQTGKVTGVKEGNCTITAIIEGTDIKDTCEVTVTKEDIPVEPDEPTGDGSLYIEMVDGNIKQAQDLDVADFIDWFKDRDFDDTENVLYKIKNAKGNTEYLVHDKIVAFEVR